MAKSKFVYKNLSFDSKLFGYKVALINDDLTPSQIPIVLKKLRHDGVRLAYWFVELKNKAALRAAKKYSGLPVDEKITYSINADTLNTYVCKGLSAVVPYERTSVSHELLSLALQSGKYSRFYIDDHFTHQEYVKLYTAWIRNSVLNKIAFEVFIYMDPTGKIKGLVSLEKNHSVGNIGLLAVDSKYRRHSIGTILIMTALRHFKSKGIRFVHVSTQRRNSSACRFYEKLGFDIIKRRRIYHFWL